MSEIAARDMRATVEILKQMLDLWADSQEKRGRDCITGMDWREVSGELHLVLRSDKKYDPALCAPWWDMAQLSSPETQE